ncbi:hypothetical protein B4Q13_15495 [Lacticaseibacillus rhamnosus]
MLPGPQQPRGLNPDPPLLLTHSFLADKRILALDLSLIVAGTNGNVGVIGWYVPQWMVEKYPDITDYRNLNKYANLFKTSKSGDQGQVLDGDPSFVTNDQALVKNLGVDAEAADVPERGVAAEFRCMFDDIGRVPFPFYIGSERDRPDPARNKVGEEVAVLPTADSPPADTLEMFIDPWRGKFERAFHILFFFQFIEAATRIGHERSQHEFIGVRIAIVMRHIIGHR